MLIHDMPYQTKLEVYDRLNCREWPAVLGKPPEGFETMNVEQKLAEVEPIMQQIEMEIGKKAVLRYHQKHNLGRTDQQFEDWWDSLGKQLFDESQDLRKMVNEKPNGNAKEQHDYFPYAVTAAIALLICLILCVELILT